MNMQNKIELKNKLDELIGALEKQGYNPSDIPITDKSLKSYICIWEWQDSYEIWSGNAQNMIKIKKNESPQS